MKFKLKSWLKPPAFGLAITETAIKIAGPKSVRVKLGKNKLSDLKKALQQAKIKPGEYANISIPEKYCFIHLSAKKEINIQKRIKENIPLPINKIYYQSQITPAGALIVSAAKKVVDDYLILLNQADIIAASVEPESLALTRALASLKGISLIIELAINRINFVIASQDSLYFTAYRRYESRALPSHQELGRQIKDYLLFFEKKQKTKVDQIAICGQQVAGMPKIDKIIAAKTNLPTSIAKKPGFCLAQGLALKKS